MARGYEEIMDEKAKLLEKLEEIEAEEAMSEEGKAQTRLQQVKKMAQNRHGDPEATVYNPWQR